MQDSKSNSVNGNPFTETGIQWLRIFFFFFFSVGKVVRYNTALARFRDNPAGFIKFYDMEPNTLIYISQNFTKFNSDTN